MRMRKCVHIQIPCKHYIWHLMCTVHIVKNNYLQRSKAFKCIILVRYGHVLYASLPSHSKSANFFFKIAIFYQKDIFLFYFFFWVFDQFHLEIPSLTHVNIRAPSSLVLKSKHAATSCICLCWFYGPVNNEVMSRRCNSLSCPPGVKIPRGILPPTLGILTPAGGQYTPAGISCPPIQNILSIKSFFLFPYAKTYYFYHIRIIIMMMTHVHTCKQITLNAWFLGVGVKIPWPWYLAPHPVLCLWALKIAN